MGSSAKKKKEKAKDFQKAKLKVGKARPKNTNATDTTFAAKSIVLKQQSLSESDRSAGAVFNHNLSLLSSKNETQRRDALQYLTTAVAAAAGHDLPQPASVVLAKAQPLILDGNKQVREQLLKLVRTLPPGQLGSVDQLLLYIRAGISHLSTDVRLSALDLLDWILSVHADAVLGCPGGWVKTLRSLQSLLNWQDSKVASQGAWSSTKSTKDLGSNKLVVHQLNSLANLLAAGLAKENVDPDSRAKRSGLVFPLCEPDVHGIPTRSNSFGHLNLFGATHDVEGEIYEDAEERAQVLTQTGLKDVFEAGVKEALKEGGEMGRAAARVAKALKSAELG